MFKTYDTTSILKSEYDRYKKWAYGITLKEFKEEVEKLGCEIGEDENANYKILYYGCKVATIDPVNECTMQTSNIFYKLQFKRELFELLTNLAYTCKEDRHLEDYFEEWQYEE